MAEHDRIEVWTYQLTDKPVRWAWSCCDETKHGYDDALSAVDGIREHITNWPVGD